MLCQVRSCAVVSKMLTLGRNQEKATEGLAVSFLKLLVILQ